MRLGAWNLGMGLGAWNLRMGLGAWNLGMRLGAWNLGMRLGAWNLEMRLLIQYYLPGPSFTHTQECHHCLLVHLPGLGHLTQCWHGTDPYVSLL